MVSRPAASNGKMPPAEEPRPDAKDVERIVKWIDADVLKVDWMARAIPAVSPSAAEPGGIQQHNPRPGRRQIPAGRRFPGG